MLGTALAYMALAFFIVRISFAAAMAAGEACGLAGAAGCCAPAGTLASARPNARPAADKTLRLFIPVLLENTALTPFNNTNSLRTCQYRRAGDTDEQPMLDDA